MEVEKAEDIEEVEDVEGAKGRTSSRMGITGAAKFARRSFQNGTRNFNLKNVWQVTEPTGRFLHAWTGKELQMYFSQVWQGKRLVDFACWARSWRDAGRRIGTVALTTKTSISC